MAEPTRVQRVSRNAILRNESAPCQMPFKQRLGLAVLRYRYITRNNLGGGAYGTYEKHVYRRALEIVGLVLGSPRPTPASYPTTDIPTLTLSVCEYSSDTELYQYQRVLSVNYH